VLWELNQSCSKHGLESGAPYDKKSVATLAYAGSLVGTTMEVDKSTLHRADYS
jgi:hypothetical protein